MYGIVWRVLRALDKNLQTVSFPIADHAALQRQAAEFAAIADGHIQGCVAAGDGLLVEVRIPPASRVVGGNNVVFLCRKGFAAVAVQAFADANKCFLYVSATSPGSTHDITAYRVIYPGR